MNFVLATIIDVTVILAAALSGAWLLRRRSAALRHAVLAAGVVMAMLAPALEALLPQWTVLAPAAPAATLQATPVTFVSGDAATAPLAAAAPTPAPIDWTMGLLAVWAAGAALGWAGLTTGLVRLRRIAGRCRRVEDGPWHATAAAIAREQSLGPITLLQSAERTLLVTYGWLRPKIVLPAESDRWSEARCRIVLGHELAHIRRGDWATQLLAEMLRILFWFHPLAWVACRRLRQESEYACDDVVMARGVEPTEYAAHLLEVARHAAGGVVPWAAAPAIAHPSTLERRIAVMLNRQRNHDPLGRHSAALVFGAALAVAVPVAAMSTAPDPQSTPPAAVVADVALAPAPVSRPPVAPAEARPLAADENVVRATDSAATVAAPVQEKPASISGALYDPLGGLLPGVALTLTDQTVGVTYTATTDRNGSFVFNELQPATYELRAVLPGFASVSTVMPIGAGMSLDRRIVMPIGSLEESITVVCSQSAAPAASRPGAAPAARLLQPRPVAATPRPGGAAPFNGGIGGQIRAPRQIAKANPICPNQVGVNTVVLLSARVGIDGYLSDIKDLRNEAKLPQERQPQEIVDSAIEAVRLWQYTPTLLNGVPVEANMMVAVSYTWQ